MFAGRAVLLCLLALAGLAQIQLLPPAGIRPPYVKGGSALLPGGRAVAPLGYQYFNGPAPIRFAVLPPANAVACLGSRTLTLFERNKQGWKLTDLPTWELDAVERSERAPWRSFWSGIAANGSSAVFTSEGVSGRVALMDWNAGRVREIDLNREGFKNSVAGDLALDAGSALLYAADQGNSRVVVIEARSRQVIASERIDGAPVRLALAPGGARLYVTAQKPGGTPQLITLDVSDPSTPKVERTVPVGTAPSSLLAAAPGPNVALADRRVIVSRSDTDSVFVFQAGGQLEKEIPIRVPGLEDLRGVRPAGMAYDPASGLLLVAEAGLNAVGVVDLAQGRVLGHLPAGWMPTQVALAGDTVFVANTKGMGPGPSVPRSARIPEGSVSVFQMPSRDGLEPYTRYVLEANGLLPRASAAPEIPAPLRRIVLIVTRGRSYDEMLGDVPRAANGPAMGAMELARFGADGAANGRGERLSLKRVEIAPNLRALARRGAFSDNFHADAGPGSPEFAFPPGFDGSFTGAYISSGALRRRLAANGLSLLYLRPGEADLTAVPDQERASRFIREIEQRYVKGGAELPRLIVVELPNGRTAPARPHDGYPYEESFVADNDLAVGRIVEYLSRSKWWRETAVFIAGDDLAGSEDHLGARRTPLVCAGPWCKTNYVSHVNTSFPGLVKTMLRVFNAPPLDLLDAAAADLSDCFTSTPDYSAYRALPVDQRVFDPASARAAIGEESAQPR